MGHTRGSSGSETHGPKAAARAQSAQTLDGLTSAGLMLGRVARFARVRLPIPCTS